MREAAEALVRDAVSLTSLPISPGLSWHGSDSDFELGWSGTKTEGMPKNFFARVYICGNGLAAGFWIEVGAYGYDLATRDGFSKKYWSRAIAPGDLETNPASLIRGALMEEIKEAVIEAWEDLSAFPQKALKRKEELEQLFERLRREGKMGE